MNHLRKDYQNRIVDLAGIIPSDEPVFLMRAKDNCALNTLHTYLTELVKRHANTEMLAAVNETINAFARFAIDNPKKMHLPNIGTAVIIPGSDSPLLQQKLNEIETLRLEGERLAIQLTKTKSLMDEYSERYSDLKKLHETQLLANDELTAENSNIKRDLVNAKLSLTQCEFDLKKSVASVQNSETSLNQLSLQFEQVKHEKEDLMKEVSTLSTALKNEKDSNAI
jgi:CII-binding regulator of phage lambda lysogenization HflD